MLAEFHFLRPMWLWLLLPLAALVWMLLRRQAGGDEAARGHGIGEALNRAALDEAAAHLAVAIRLRPDLEPYGAIGDAGWYTMRAAADR